MSESMNSRSWRANASCIAGGAGNNLERHLDAFRADNPRHKPEDIKHLRIAAQVCRDLGFDVAKSQSCMDILTTAVKEASTANALLYRDEFQTYCEVQYYFPTTQTLKEPLSRLCAAHDVPRLATQPQPPSLT